MFSSISSCAPDSTVTTSFISNKIQILDITLDVVLKINGVVYNTRPVTLNTGDLVEVDVTTSSSYLGYRIIEYNLGGYKNYFAVVNKNNYTPTVKIAERGKRWFNYSPNKFLITYYNSLDNFQRPLGFGKRSIDIDQAHVVLDHINNAACFYNKYYEMVTRITLPAGPVAYAKHSYFESKIQATAKEVVILCSNKRIYRVRFDNSYVTGDEFSPTVIPVEFGENLWFEQDLPSGESFIESRRTSFLSKTKPPTTALDISDNYIWLGGYDTVYVLSRSFQQLFKIDIPQEKIIDIAHLGDDAIAVGRDGKLFYISFNGGVNVTQIFQKFSLGTPCNINNKVIIPDPDSQRLLVFTDSSGDYTTINTPDFAPAYARVFNNTLWVTGHDTNIVLKFNSDLTSYETLAFSNKVTVVSNVDESLLAVHYLQDFVILDLTGIKKIIPFSIAKKRGPVSHIGSEPAELKMLGEEDLTPVPSPGLTAWTNGIINEPSKTGDYFGVSYRSENPGIYRSAVILGENAIDYDVEVVSNYKEENFFQANTTAINRLTGIYGIYTPPDVGDVDNGVTGPIPLGFEWSMNGKIYNEIYVSTNGYIFFDPDTPYGPIDFGGHGDKNVLYVEPGNLKQAGAINNVDPLNIYEKLDSNETPGIYFKPGILDDFKYFRLRWVGTDSNLNLSGITKLTTESIENWNFIPLTNTSSITANMYISGSGVNSSTTVISTTSLTRVLDNLLGANLSNNYLILDNSNNYTYPKYSTITNSYNNQTNFVVSNSKISFSSNILAVVDDSLIFENFTNSIDSEYLATIPLSLGGNFKTFTINNVSIVNETIEILNIENNTNAFISSDNINSLFTNQKVYGNTVNVTGNVNVINEILQEDDFTLKIVFSEETNLSANDIITTNTSVIEFNSNLSQVDIATGDLAIFEKYSLIVNNLSVLLDSNVALETQQLTLTGNFAEVSNNLTISADTEILFASNISVPEKTYEVGFYSGRGFQYLEYFYDSNNHIYSSNVGLSSGNVLLSVQSSSGNTIVFTSKARVGEWSFLGNGSVDTDFVGFLPRGVTYIKSIVEQPTQDRIEIYIDRDITKDDNILAAVDYGYLTINSAPYYGNTTVSKGSVISLVAPFNDSLRTIAPILSIGEYQFAIPMDSRLSTNNLETVLVTYDNQPDRTVTTGNIAVTVTGTYYIPNYFRYTSELSTNDIAFLRIRNGTTTTLNPGYQDLLAGDQIRVVRHLTPSGIYNFNDINIVGPVNLLLRWRTSPGDIFDSFNFNTLVDPYTRFVLSEFNDVTSLYTYSENEDLNITSNILLTSNVGITGNIFVDNPETYILIDGILSTNNWVYGVSVNSNIALARRILNYYQSNVNVFQVKYDTITSTNVYIPIGTWGINNIQVDTETNIFDDANSVLNAANSVEESTQQVFEIETEEIIAQTASMMTDNLTSLLEDNIQQKIFDIPATFLIENYTSSSSQFNTTSIIDKIASLFSEKTDVVKFNTQTFINKAAIFDISNNFSFITNNFGGSEFYKTNSFKISQEYVPSNNYSFILNLISYQLTNKLSDPLTGNIQYEIDNTSSLFKQTLENLDSDNKTTTLTNFITNIFSKSSVFEGRKLDSLNENSYSSFNLSTSQILDNLKTYFHINLSNDNYVLNNFIIKTISAEINDKQNTFSNSLLYDLQNVENAILSGLVNNTDSNKKLILGEINQILDSNVKIFSNDLSSKLDELRTNFKILTTEKEDTNRSVLGLLISNKLENLSAPLAIDLDLLKLANFAELRDVLTVLLSAKRTEIEKINDATYSPLRKELSKLLETLIITKQTNIRSQNIAQSNDTINLMTDIFDIEKLFSGTEVYKLLEETKATDPTEILDINSSFKDKSGSQIDVGLQNQINTLVTTINAENLLVTESFLSLLRSLLVTKKTDNQTQLINNLQNNKETLSTDFRSEFDIERLVNSTDLIDAFDIVNEKTSKSLFYSNLLEKLVSESANRTQLENILDVFKTNLTHSNETITDSLSTIFETLFNVEQIAQQALLNKILDKNVDVPYTIISENLVNEKEDLSAVLKTVLSNILNSIFTLLNEKNNLVLEKTKKLLYAINTLMEDKTLSELNGVNTLFNDSNRAELRNILIGELLSKSTDFKQFLSNEFIEISTAIQDKNSGILDELKNLIYHINVLSDPIIRKYFRFTNINANDSDKKYLIWDNQETLETDIVLLSNKLDLVSESLRNYFFDKNTLVLDNLKNLFNGILSAINDKKYSYLTDSLDNTEDIGKNVFKLLLSEEFTKTTTEFSNRFDEMLSSVKSDLLNSLLVELSSNQNILSDILDKSIDTGKNLLIDTVLPLIEKIMSIFRDSIQTSLNLSNIIEHPLSLSGQRFTTFDINLETILDTATHTYTDTNISFENSKTIIFDQIDLSKDNFTEFNINLALLNLSPTIFSLEGNLVNIRPTEITYHAEYIGDTNYTLSEISGNLVNIRPTEIIYNTEYIKDVYTVSNISALSIIDSSNVTLVPTAYTLDSDILWVDTALDKNITTKTNVSIWADNGRGGDKITNMGTPPDRNPFVLYTKDYEFLPGAYNNVIDAANMAVKYTSATAFQILGTDYWNYRIYFNNRHYCVPRRGTVFPTKWYIRGG